ncbi:unnamed protein product [Zymoseptoria tritici ST99CH_3D7]|uniref:Uncharacterized protein n=1 Tax=Zymoseptoria tritici (strain ST99CH_3D7) TaxID=1276538 RepID=A0A1X7RFX2_ZYMT9|nr:unnamed protein product [Zymoseptoria tritici ST99CH_3D7]
MAKASASSAPTRSSGRRRKPTIAADTIAVKQKLSSITISDSSDELVAPDVGPSRKPGRARAKSGKATMISAASKSMDDDAVEEYQFTDGDYYYTDEEEGDDWEDTMSVISLSSSDSNDGVGLDERPWSGFSTEMRRQWEFMYAEVTVRQLSNDWEVTEYYQLQKDNEMLRYMEDFPLPQWLIPQEVAQQAYFRLLERMRWRGQGMPIYGRHVHPSEFAPGGAASSSTLQPLVASQHQILNDPARSAPPCAKRSENEHQPSQQRLEQKPASVPPQQPCQSTAHNDEPTTQSQGKDLARQIQHEQQQFQPKHPQAQTFPPHAQPPPPSAQHHGGPPMMHPQQMHMNPQQFQQQQQMHQQQMHHQHMMLQQQMHPPMGPLPPHLQHPPQNPPYPFHLGYYPGMGRPGGMRPNGTFGMQQTYPPMPPSAQQAPEPPKRRAKKETPPPASPPPPPQTPPYEARKRPIEKKVQIKAGRRAIRKPAEAEDFPWARQIDYKAEKEKATWDLSIYDPETLRQMEATRQRNIPVIDDIDTKIQEQQRMARAGRKAKDKAGNSSETEPGPAGKKERKKREGRPKGETGGDPYHSGNFAYVGPEDEAIAKKLGYELPDDLLDAAEEGKIDPDVQATIKICWNPGKKGMTENLEQGKFSVRDTIATRKQLDERPILTRVAAECIVDFCPDMLWRSMLLRITSEAGYGNKDVRDRFCYNGCYCDKATITKRISAALGQKQTQPKSKGYQPGEWEWYDENVKDFSKYIDFFGMRTSHRNMLKIQMAGEKRKRDKQEELKKAEEAKKGKKGGKDGEDGQDEDGDDDKEGDGDAMDVDGEDEPVEADVDGDAADGSGDESDDSNAVSAQDSDILDKMED